MSKYWTSDEDKLLIEFVRGHDALFNIKSKNYRKTQIKQRLWCEIATDLNKTDFDCCKRWCYVRDYYIRRKSKAGTRECGEAARKRAALLSFLDGFPSAQRTSIAHVEDKIRQEIEEENVSESSYKSQNSHQSIGTNVYNENNDRNINSYIIKRKYVPQPSERITIVQQEPPRMINQNELDENDLFFSCMAKIVKKLPKVEQVQLRMQIGSLVTNAELSCLSSDSHGSQMSPDIVASDMLEIITPSPRQTRRPSSPTGHQSANT